MCERFLRIERFYYSLLNVEVRANEKCSLILSSNTAVL